MRILIQALAVAGLVSFSASCAGYRSNVTLRGETAAPATGQTLQLPVCTDMPLPDYPASLLTAQLPMVPVRVNFRIEATGAISRIRAAAIGRTENPELFEAEAISAVSSWTCRGASRLSQVGDAGPYIFRPVAYDTYVTFQFDVKKVRRSGPIGRH